MPYPHPPTNAQEHIDYLIVDPLKYESDGYFQLLTGLPDSDLPTFKDLRDALKRIYNMNENSLLEHSDATTGVMGYLNKKDTERRIKKFYDLIEDGFRNPAKPKNKVILAEGDSWFNFPTFIDDIIDHLMQKRDFAVYSIAYGGDWIANIIYEEKYVEEISVLRPDVFLISGAGNDMVGDNKLALMVHPDPQRCKYNAVTEVSGYWDSKLPVSWTKYHADKAEIYEGHRHLTTRFYSFIQVMKVNYYLILRNLNKAPDFKNKTVIIQGYDYAIPSLKNHWSFRYPIQFFVNKFVGTGRWLSRPMAIQGILEEKTQAKIMKAMIFFLNEMFIQLADPNSFPNITVSHLDNRYIADEPADWYDELHLKDYKFREIANVYSKIIKGTLTDSVVAAKDHCS